MPSMTCRECGAPLNSADEVILHLESVHPIANPGASEDRLCPGCPAKFRQVLQLKRHLTEAHGM